MAVSIFINCDFSLPGAEKVTFVWDGQERLIKCTSGNYKDSFEVFFGSERSKLVHFCVDGMESDDHELPRPTPLFIYTYNMSVERTGDKLSISGEVSMSGNFALEKVTPKRKFGGESAMTVSDALPKRSKLSPGQKETRTAEFKKI